MVSFDIGLALSKILYEKQEYRTILKKFIGMADF